MSAPGETRDVAERTPTARTAIAIRLPDDLHQRLRSVMTALDISQAEVLEMGIELAERRLAADEYE